MSTVLVGISRYPTDAEYVVIRRDDTEIELSRDEAEVLWSTLAAVLDKLSDRAHDTVRVEAAMSRDARKDVR